MHPIERLRYVARAGEVDATELACEAAYALAGLASDRRALVQACRRLLEFHPDCAPLWWVSAHALDAIDLRAVIFRVVGQLEDDASIDELFALPASTDVVVAQSSRQIVRALSERPDIAVRLVGAPHQVRSGLRFFSDSFTPPQGYTTDEIDLALKGATVVIVEALVASSAGYLFDEPGRLIAESAIRAELPLHVLAGVGRILPIELFQAMVSRLDMHASRDNSDLARPTMEALAGLSAGPHSVSLENERTKSIIIAVDYAYSVVTERGQQMTKVVFHHNPSVSHQRCPVPAELLAPFGIAG
jgi:hypothetical protein